MALGGGVLDPNANPVTGSGGSGNVDGCAATTSEAKLSPVYLVFLLDESGSMGDSKSMNREERWDPVTSALNGFFADASSTGLMASLTLFPKNKNTTMGHAEEQSLPPDCLPEAYVEPVIAPRMLPDASSFSDAIAQVTPPNEFGTPTLPALQGTLTYAQSLLTQDPLRKVAVVLVTDGEPAQCSGNSVENIASAAAAVANTIPTYVIGVGSLTSLNQIAQGGGTDSAFIVSLANPEQTRTEFLAAIEEIRGRSISCDLELPAPPAGKTLDPDKVRVELTASGQGPSELPYDPTCATGLGWHYDDPVNPQRILLCDSSCTSAKADVQGRLDVVFGCVVRDDVK